MNLSFQEFCLSTGQAERHRPESAAPSHRKIKDAFFSCFSENPETPPSLFEQSESLHQDLRTKSSFWPLPFGTGREPEKAEELSYWSRLHRRRVHQSSPRVVNMRRALLRPTNMHPGISMTRLLVAKSHLPH